MLSNGPNPRQGHKTDNAHPPIHPVKHAANLQVQQHPPFLQIMHSFLISSVTGTYTLIEESLKCALVHRTDKTLSIIYPVYLFIFKMLQITGCCFVVGK